MEDGTRGVRQHHVEKEKEKNRKVMVSRTPGGGMQRGRALAASNQCCDDANRAHDEHVHVRSKPSTSNPPQLLWTLRALSYPSHASQTARTVEHWRSASNMSSQSTV